MDWPNRNRQAQQVLRHFPYSSTPSFTLNSTWTNLVSGGLPYRASGLIIEIGAPSSVFGLIWTIIEIGLGGSGASSTTVIEGMLCLSGTHAVHTFAFPIEIPPNTRIAVRGSESTASSLTAGINITPIYSSWGYESCSYIRAVGLGTRTTFGGVGVTPGLSGAKGSWATLSGALPKTARGCMLRVLPQNTASASGDHQYAVDCHNTNGATPTDILMPDLLMCTGGAGTLGVPHPYPSPSGAFPWLPIEWAAGSPAYVRMACEKSATPQLWDAILYVGEGG
jgi:hypothetical protein